MDFVSPVRKYAKMESFDIVGAIERLFRRSGLKKGEISRRMGYGSDSGYQRYIDPNTYKDRDYLLVKEARRLMKGLVGTGEPSIKAREIWELLRLTPDEIQLTIELSEGGEIHTVDNIVMAVSWLQSKGAFKGATPEEAGEMVALACHVLQAHPSSDPEVLATLLSYEEGKRRLRGSNGETREEHQRRQA